jgi:hypothetical protein
MSVLPHFRMRAALPEVDESGRRSHSPLQSWIVRGALALAGLGVVCTIGAPTASAVPSYARQTGQPCATCHTAFLELTPFGREFKLMGYTAGGTRCKDGSAKSDETQIPLAIMAVPATYTKTKNNDNYNTFGAPADGVNVGNGQWTPAQYSVFVAGQLYCDVGAFAQITYDPISKVTAWDNVDVRWAKTVSIAGSSVVFGLTAHNNPGVQDVWNTSPAWKFPYIDTPVGPGAPFGTMLGSSAYEMQVGGVGAYAWINSSIYAEVTIYNSMSPRLLANWNGGFDSGAPRLDGSSPYWRLAYEKNWDKNSLMVGTSGMFARQLTQGLDGPAGVTDATLNLGVDAQYQYIGELHAFTVRAGYVWERKKNDVENAAGMDVNPVDYLNDFNISASYIYDRKYSFTAGRFITWGNADQNLYQTFNGLPDTSYWKFDVAYLPFMNGGPEIWPWFNARIGVTYTHFDKYNGSWNNVDGVNGVPNLGLKAGGNDQVFVYTWFMF